MASIASLYDPLGLISPITVRLKRFYQQICDANCKWDEELPPNFASEWQNILNELLEIDSIRIDRIYHFEDELDPIKSVQIHAFSDASEKMIAASICVRFEFNSGKTKLR